MEQQKNKIKWKTPLRILLALIFFAGVGFIAFFKFQNRDLKIFLYGKNVNYTIELPQEAIASGKINSITIPDVVEGANIKKIRITGMKNQSLRLMESNSDAFYYYLASPESDGVSITENGIMFLRSGNISLTMNDAFVEQMKKFSASYLQERLIYSGWLACFIILCSVIVTAIADWKSEDNWDNHSPLYEFKKFWGDMKKYRKYMVYAAQTDLKAEVANSYLNRLWWLLEPLFSMLVYIIVFGGMMGRTIENYATFCFSALLMWNFFNKTLNYSVKLVRGNRDIVTKIYVPKFILLGSNMVLNMYKILFSLIVLVPMLIIFKVHIGLNIIWIIPPYIIMILIAFGFGMILLHYGVYVDDLAYAIGILLNMMMFLSGLFYDVISGLVYPLNVLMLCLNPMSLCMDTMRNALLYNNVSNLPLLAVWFVIAVLLCCIGVHIVYKNENSYVKII